MSDEKRISVSHTTCADSYCMARVNNEGDYCEKHRTFAKAWSIMKDEDAYQAPPLRTNGDADYRFYSQPEDEYAREGGFSKSPCDTCHQHLAGNRYKVSAANKETEPIDLEICEDCLMELVGGYDVKRRG